MNYQRRHEVVASIARLAWAKGHEVGAVRGFIVGVAISLVIAGITVWVLR